MGRDMGIAPMCSRERRDGLRAEVLAVPAPPTPVLPAPWLIRVARADGDDLDLVHGWMNAPHVAPFWDQAWSRERWADELGTQLAGSYSRPYIVEMSGRPFMYVELYRAARDVVADHYPALPHDIGLHGAIGEPDMAGRGIAFRFWLHILPAVFAAEPQCRRVVTDPAAEHTVARRLDEGVARRVGGSMLGEVQLPHKRAALFVYPRSPQDLPAPVGQVAD